MRQVKTKVGASESELEARSSGGGILGAYFAASACSMTRKSSAACRSEPRSRESEILEHAEREREREREIEREGRLRSGDRWREFEVARSLAAQLSLHFPTLRASGNRSRRGAAQSSARSSCMPSSRALGSISQFANHRPSPPELSSLCSRCRSVRHPQLWSLSKRRFARLQRGINAKLRACTLQL